ncbi:MAG: hypothetical protein ACJ746_24290 [Bryobacteraceae bacterium]
MNPDLELFLQDVFGNIQRGDSPVPRVAVEPDYESGSTDADPEKLRAELSQLLAEQKADENRLRSHEGVEVNIPSKYTELAKTVRRVFLHGDKEDGPWVEVIPPGSWI